MSRFRAAQYAIHDKIGRHQPPISTHTDRRQCLIAIEQVLTERQGCPVLVHDRITGQWEYWRDTEDYPRCEFSGSESALMEFLGMAPGRIEDQLPDPHNPLEL